MVHKETCRRSSIAKRKGGLILFALLFLILIVSFGVSLGIMLFYGHDVDHSVDSDSQNTAIDSIPNEVVEPNKNLPPEISFQTIVDNWANNASGNKSVLIYDIERGDIVGEFNSDTKYNTASLYKLFVVYEGYRRIASGEWSPDMSIGRTNNTLLQCLDLAIRESNSSCAEPIWAMIGHDRLDEIIVDDYKITNSDISSLVSNPRDILEIMKLFYNHPDFDDYGLISKIKDSFLNQPITEYNWRQGLPSGFRRANVYNKVGWDYNPDKKYWNIYHDASIVEFPESNRHFIVIVMTNYVSFQQIRNLGTMIENYYYDNYNI